MDYERLQSSVDTKELSLRAQGTSANLSVLKVDILGKKFKEPEPVGSVVL